MKKILVAVLFVLCVLGISTSAMAIVLPPSNVFSEGNLAPITTSPILEIINAPFTGIDAEANVFFTGTLTQRVYREEAGLLFTYEFTNASTSVDPIQSLSTQNFTGFTTDVDVEYSEDTLLKRSLSGSTITFFAPGDGVLQGETTPLLWIQTNAKSYKWGSTQLQDGGNDRVRTYAPATPEPSTMVLLGMGILGLFGLGRKKA